MQIKNGNSDKLIRELVLIAGSVNHDGVENHFMELEEKESDANERKGHVGSTTKMCQILL